MASDARVPNVHEPISDGDSVASNSEQRRSERKRKDRLPLFSPDDFITKRKMSSSSTAAADGASSSPVEDKKRRNARHKHPAASAADRPYDVLPNGQPFTCDLCQSSYVCNPLLSKGGSRGKRSRHMPIPRQKLNPTTGKLLTLCNACCQSLEVPRPSRRMVGATQEEKDTYLAEAKAFASHLALSLQDAEAERFYCPGYNKTPCRCLQKYISADGNAEQTLERGRELLALHKQSRKLAAEKVYTLDKVVSKPPSSKKKAPDGSIGLGNGHKRSKRYELFVLHHRKRLKQDLHLCEKATQRILCYSNNFIHKKLKTEERGRRVERQKGKAALGLLEPLESLEKRHCCVDRCVWMVHSHKNLLAHWRRRAMTNQREARRVLAEMLTPSGGMRCNCYKFISWVTGCSHSTISKVRGQMQLTQGLREPPLHGLFHFWERKTLSSQSHSHSQSQRSQSQHSQSHSAQSQHSQSQHSQSQHSQSHSAQSHSFQSHHHNHHHDDDDDGWRSRSPPPHLPLSATVTTQDADSRSHGSYTADMSHVDSTSSFNDTTGGALALLDGGTEGQGQQMLQLEGDLLQQQSNMSQQQQQQMFQQQLSTLGSRQQQWMWSQNASRMASVQQQVLQQMTQLHSTQQQLTSAIHSLQQQLASLQTPATHLPTTPTHHGPLAAALQVPAAHLTPLQIPAGQIISLQIPANQVASLQIPANQIGSLQIPANQIGSLQIPANQIGSLQIPANQIGSLQIPGSQTTPLQVPANQIASLQIPANQIASLHIPANQVASLQIPANQIGSVQVPANQIGSLQVPTNHISSVPVPVTAFPTVAVDGVGPATGASNAQFCTTLLSPPNAQVIAGVPPPPSNAQISVSFAAATATASQVSTALLPSLSALPNSEVSVQLPFNPGGSQMAAVQMVKPGSSQMATPPPPPQTVSPAGDVQISCQQLCSTAGALSSSIAGGPLLSSQEFVNPPNTEVPVEFRGQPIPPLSVQPARARNAALMSTGLGQTQALQTEQRQLNSEAVHHHHQPLNSEAVHHHQILNSEAVHCQHQPLNSEAVHHHQLLNSEAVHHHKQSLNSEAVHHHHQPGGGKVLAGGQSLCAPPGPQAAGSQSWPPSHSCGPHAVQPNASQQQTLTVQQSSYHHHHQQQQQQQQQRVQCQPGSQLFSQGASQPPPYFSSTHVIQAETSQFKAVRQVEPPACGATATEGRLRQSNLVTQHWMLQQQQMVTIAQGSEPPQPLQTQPPQTLPPQTQPPQTLPPPLTLPPPQTQPSPPPQTQPPPPTASLLRPVVVTWIQPGQAEQAGMSVNLPQPGVEPPHCGQALLASHCLQGSSVSVSAPPPLLHHQQQQAAGSQTVPVQPSSSAPHSHLHSTQCPSQPHQSPPLHRSEVQSTASLQQSPHQRQGQSAHHRDQDWEQSARHTAQDQDHQRLFRPPPYRTRPGRHSKARVKKSSDHAQDSGSKGVPSRDHVESSSPHGDEGNPVVPVLPVSSDSVGQLVTGGNVAQAAKSLWPPQSLIEASSKSREPGIKVLHAAPSATQDSGHGGSLAQVYQTPVASDRTDTEHSSSQTSQAKTAPNDSPLGGRNLSELQSPLQSPSVCSRTPPGPASLPATARTPTAMTEAMASASPAWSILEYPQTSALSSTSPQAPQPLIVTLSPQTVLGPGHSQQPVILSGASNAPATLLLQQSGDVPQLWVCPPLPPPGATIQDAGNSRSGHNQAREGAGIGHSEAGPVQGVTAGHQQSSAKQITFDREVQSARKTVLSDSVPAATAVPLPMSSLSSSSVVTLPASPAVVAPSSSGASPLTVVPQTCCSLLLSPTMSWTVMGQVVSSCPQLFTGTVVQQGPSSSSVSSQPLSSAAVVPSASSAILPQALLSVVTPQLSGVPTTTSFSASTPSAPAYILPQSVASAVKPQAVPSAVPSTAQAVPSTAQAVPSTAQAVSTTAAITSMGKGRTTQSRPGRQRAKGKRKGDTGRNLMTVVSPSQDGVGPLNQGAGTSGAVRLAAEHPAVSSTASTTAVTSSCVVAMTSNMVNMASSGWQTVVTGSAAPLTTLVLPSSLFLNGGQTTVLPGSSVQSTLPPAVLVSPAISTGVVTTAAVSSEPSSATSSAPLRVLSSEGSSLHSSAGTVIDFDSSALSVIEQHTSGTGVISGPPLRSVPTVLVSASSSHQTRVRSAPMLKEAPTVMIPGQSQTHSKTVEFPVLDTGGEERAEKLHQGTRADVLSSLPASIGDSISSASSAAVSNVGGPPTGKRPRKKSGFRKPKKHLGENANVEIQCAKRHSAGEMSASTTAVSTTSYRLSEDVQSAVTVVSPGINVARCAENIIEVPYGNTPTEENHVLSGIQYCGKATDVSVSTIAHLPAASQAATTVLYKRPRQTARIVEKLVAHPLHTDSAPDAISLSRVQQSGIAGLLKWPPFVGESITSSAVLLPGSDQSAFRVMQVLPGNAQQNPSGRVDSPSVSNVRSAAVSGSLPSSLTLSDNSVPLVVAPFSPEATPVSVMASTATSSDLVSGIQSDKILLPSDSASLLQHGGPTRLPAVAPSVHTVTPSTQSLPISSLSVCSAASSSLQTTGGAHPHTASDLQHTVSLTTCSMQTARLPQQTAPAFQQILTSSQQTRISCSPVSVTTSSQPQQLQTSLPARTTPSSLTASATPLQSPPPFKGRLLRAQLLSVASGPQDQPVLDHSGTEQTQSLSTPTQSMPAQTMHSGGFPVVTPSQQTIPHVVGNISILSPATPRPSQSTSTLSGSAPTATPLSPHITPTIEATLATSHASPTMHRATPTPSRATPVAPQATLVASQTTPIAPQTTPVAPQATPTISQARPGGFPVSVTPMGEGKKQMMCITSPMNLQQLQVLLSHLKLPAGCVIKQVTSPIRGKAQVSSGVGLAEITVPAPSAAARVGGSGGRERMSSSDHVDAVIRPSVDMGQGDGGQASITCGRVTVKRTGRENGGGDGGGTRRKVSRNWGVGDSAGVPENVPGWNVTQPPTPLRQAPTVHNIPPATQSGTASVEMAPSVAAPAKVPLPVGITMSSGRARTVRQTGEPSCGKNVGPAVQSSSSPVCRKDWAVPWSDVASLEAAHHFSASDEQLSDTSALHTSLTPRPNICAPPDNQPREECLELGATPKKVRKADRARASISASSQSISLSTVTPPLAGRWVMPMPEDDSFSGTSAAAPLSKQTPPFLPRGIHGTASRWTGSPSESDAASGAAAGRVESQQFPLGADAMCSNQMVISADNRPPGRSGQSQSTPGHPAGHYAASQAASRDSGSLHSEPVSKRPRISSKSKQTRSRTSPSLKTPPAFGKSSPPRGEMHMAQMQTINRLSGSQAGEKHTVEVSRGPDGCSGAEDSTISSARPGATLSPSAATDVNVKQPAAGSCRSLSAPSVQSSVPHAVVPKSNMPHNLVSDSASPVSVPPHVNGDAVPSCRGPVTQFVLDSAGNSVPQLVCATATTASSSLTPDNVSTVRSTILQQLISGDDSAPGSNVPHMSRSENVQVARGAASHHVVSSTVPTALKRSVCMVRSGDGHHWLSDATTSSRNISPYHFLSDIVTSVPRSGAPHHLLFNTVNTAGGGSAAPPPPPHTGGSDSVEEHQHSKNASSHHMIPDSSGHVRSGFGVSHHHVVCDTTTTTTMTTTIFPAAGSNNSSSSNNNSSSSIGNNVTFVFNPMQQADTRHPVYSSAVDRLHHASSPAAMLLPPIPSSSSSTSSLELMEEVGRDVELLSSSGPGGFFPFLSASSSRSRNSSGASSIEPSITIDPALLPFDLMQIVTQQGLALAVTEVLPPVGGGGGNGGAGGNGGVGEDSG